MSRKKPTYSKLRKNRGVWIGGGKKTQMCVFLPSLALTSIPPLALCFLNTHHKSIWKKFLKIEDIPDWRFTYFFCYFWWDETTNGLSCKIITTKTNSHKLRPDWDKKFELLRWEIGFSSTRISQLSCKVGRPFNIYKIMYIDM